MMARFLPLPTILAAVVATALATPLALLPARAEAQDFLQRLLQQAPGLAADAVHSRDALLGTIDEGQEHRMGQTASAVLLGAAPLLGDPIAQSYLNVVGRWLTLHIERPDLPWRFGILDDGTVNAFAAPGGYVFITRGLFLMLRSEHELAGVLGHEIGHVLRRHHVHALIKQERFRTVLDVFRRASGRDGLLMEALVGATREMYARGLDQEDEYEADRIGAVVAARAGYDPYGLVHVLRTLAGAREDTELTGFFLGTHPPVAERIASLEALLSGLPPPGRRPPLVDSLSSMQDRMRLGP
jgi:beta-barrel assembly-enhancing protease